MKQQDMIEALFDAIDAKEPPHKNKAEFFMWDFAWWALEIVDMYLNDRLSIKTIEVYWARIKTRFDTFMGVKN